MGRVVPHGLLFSSFRVVYEYRSRIYVIRYSEYRMGLFYHTFDVERDDLKSTILGRRSSASD